MNKIFTIYKKELKEIFKDKKAIFMTIFFPIILYPSLIAISTFLSLKGQDRVDKTVNTIIIEKTVEKNFINEITKDSDFEIIEKEDYERAIENKEADLYLSFDKDKKIFNIYYNSTKDESKSALDKIDKHIKKYKEKNQKALLKEKGISENFLKIYDIEEKNLASKEKIANQILGIVFPLIILLPLVGSIMYSALDLTCGEKERKTIETLFILPVKSESIMLAKLLAVISMGVFGTIINFLGMALSFFIAKSFVKELNDFLGQGLDYGFIFKCLLMTIPLIFIVSGVGLIVGLLSKDYKEAQNYVTPVYLVLIFPVYFVTSPGWALEGIMTYIPVLNVFLSYKDLSLGNVSFTQMFLVLLTNIGFATVVLIIFAKLFNSETILFIDEKGFNFSLKRIKAIEKKGLEVSEIIVFYFIMMMLLVSLGGLLQLKLGVSGLFLTQVLLIMLPSIALIRFLNLDYKNLFPIKKVKLFDTVGAIGFWFIVLMLVGIITSIQLKLFPSQLKDLELLNKFMLDTKLWEKILIFSLTPAICEEILFRGLIFGSLKEKMDMKYAIILSGFLFGLFHLYPGKILSTALLGMLFAYVVAKTGSIITAMILHFINNSFSLLLGSNIKVLEQNLILSGIIGFIMLLLSIIGFLWFSQNRKMR